MKKTEFKIKTKNNIQIKGDYKGNLTNKQVVIFSHGFGVKRDSYGMFTELSKVLEDQYLTIKFDYNLVNREENWTKVLPIKTQVEMLETITEFAQKKFDPKKIHIIAHSMGCVVTSLAQITNIDKVILLAGPSEPPYNSLKEYFLRKKGTKINKTEISEMPRSDGSTTYVSSDFWSEIKKINPSIRYNNLAQSSSVTFVRPLEDQNIKNEDYSTIKNNKKINFQEISGNHMFEESARSKLKKLIKNILSS